MSEISKSTNFEFKQVVESAQESFGTAPENAKVVFSVQSEQVAGLRSQVKARDFTIEVDEPEALAGTDLAPNPVEYVLAALASCQEITYRLFADNLGIPVDNVSVSLEGDIDLRGFFAVDPSIRPGYQAINGSVTLEGPATDAEYRRLKEIVDAHCPVLDVLKNPVPVDIGLNINTLAKVA